MDGWARVAAAVVDRRGELDMSQKQLAASAGVSERTIQNLEAGSKPQARNRHKIELALGWEAGEMRRIESGAERSPPRPEIPPSLLAAIANDPELSDEQRVAVIAAVDETLARERGASASSASRAAPERRRTAS